MISVIVGHANLVNGWATERSAHVGPGPNFWDYFYFQVQSCAVPCFVLVSMVLFTLKPVTWERTKDRLEKLLFLYGFWVGAWILYSKSAPEKPGLWGMVEFLLRGGGWVFYFLPVLIISTLLCRVAAMLPRRGQWAGLAISALVLAGTSAWLYSQRRWSVQHYYWLPLCFVTLPFLAVILAPHLENLAKSPRLRYRLALALLVGAIALGWLEWMNSLPPELLTPERRWVPKHGRFSIQLGALLLVILSLGVKRPAGFVIQFLSRNALGIYCLHPFVLGGVVKAVGSVIGRISPDLQYLTLPLGCVAVIFGCGIGAEFLRRAFRRRLV